MKLVRLLMFLIVVACIALGLLASYSVFSDAGLLEYSVGAATGAFGGVFFAFLFGSFVTSAVEKEDHNPGI